MVSHSKYRLGSLAGSIARKLFLIFAILFIIIPFIYFISVSFQPREFTQSLAPNLNFKPTLDNYRRVFSSLHFFEFFKNSLIICTSATAISLIIGSFAAYTISRVKRKFVDNIAFWILTQRMLPAIAVLIPIYLLMARLRLLDTYPGIILIYTVLNLPYVVWMTRSFFEDIPIELDESAMLDGCSKIRIIFRIIYPITKPGLFATGVFVFVLSWSEFIFALIVTSIQTKTLPVAIASFITDVGIEWKSMTAAGSILIIPLAVLFFLIQKSLIKGLSFGAVKG